MAAVDWEGPLVGHDNELAALALRPTHQSSDQERKRNPRTDDCHQIQAGLLVMLTVPAHLLGKPIAGMLELGATLTGRHLHHQLPLGQDVSREATQLDRKGNSLG